MGTEIGKYKNAVHHRNGLCSHVYKARAPQHGLDNLSGSEHSGALVALKVTVPSADAPPHNSEREVRLLEKARSSNVIPLWETFRQAGGRLVMVFPFMPYGLDQLLQRQQLPEPQGKACLQDLFTALAHVHSQGIIHRDVKPSNILLKSLSGPAYLADFGIAWSGDDPDSEPANHKITDVGTACYRPPELLFGNTKYGASLDLWAAGCVAAEVTGLGNRTLFDAGDLGSELALVQSIFKSLGTPNLEVWPVCVCRSYMIRVL